MLTAIAYGFAEQFDHAREGVVEGFVAGRASAKDAEDGGAELAAVSVQRWVRMRSALRRAVSAVANVADAGPIDGDAAEEGVALEVADELGRRGIGVAGK